MLLTSRLSEGADAYLTPILSSKKGGKQGTLKLEDIKEAAVIHIRESGGTRKLISHKDWHTDDEQPLKLDWLSLYIREILGKPIISFPT